MNYSKSIKKLRGLKRLSQKEFAKRLNVDPSLISLIESGDRQPTDEFLKKVIQKLDVPKQILDILAEPKIQLGGFSELETKKLINYLIQLLDEESD